MKKLILVLGVLVSGPAMAGTTKTVTIDVYPYLGTFGSSGMDVEQQLSDKLGEACGSLEAVSSVSDLHLETAAMSISKINPRAEPGEVGLHAARFVLAYPRVTGTALVSCKE